MRESDEARNVPYSKYVYLGSKEDFRVRMVDALPGSNFINYILMLLLVLSLEVPWKSQYS